jgi:hypothetical protein
LVGDVPGQCLAGKAIGTSQWKIELRARYIFSGNEAQLFSGNQFRAQHFRECRRHPTLLRPARQVTESENRNGTTDGGRVPSRISDEIKVEPVTFAAWWLWKGYSNAAGE